MPEGCLDIDGLIRWSNLSWVATDVDRGPGAADEPDTDRDIRSPSCAIDEKLGRLVNPPSSERVDDVEAVSVEVSRLDMDSELLAERAVGTEEDQSHALGRGKEECETECARPNVLSG